MLITAGLPRTVRLRKSLSSINSLPVTCLHAEQQHTLKTMPNTSLSNLARLINQLTSLEARQASVSSECKPKPVTSEDAVTFGQSPFKPLPNVSRVKIVTNVADPLFSKDGVVRKLAPKMEFDPLSGRTKAANRYMRIMYGRLIWLLKNERPIQFWILACMLMKDSKVLRALALRKILPNWHRDLKFGHVLLLMRELDGLLLGLPTTLLIKRRYEPKIKPDGTKTWRPIGNPKYPVRMFFYCWQCFLVIFTHRYVGKYQFAYRPGIGVPDALPVVERLLKSAKFVYEFDLKGAFPSVNIVATCKALQSIGVPQTITDYLMNQSTTTIERVDLRPLDQDQYLDEPKFDHQMEHFESPVAEQPHAPAPLTFDGGEIEPPSWLDDKVDDMISGDYTPTLAQAREARLFLINSVLLSDEQFDYNQGYQSAGFQAAPDYKGLVEKYLPSLKAYAWHKVPVTWEVLDKIPDEMDAFQKAMMSAFSQELGAVAAKNLSATAQEAGMSKDEADARAKELTSLAGTQVSSSGLLYEDAIVERGFPQGAGTSPVLFNFAFEHFAYRPHFKQLDPSVKLVAYADDFIVFSDVELPTVSDLPNNGSGLEINHEKSRPVKLHGKFVESSMKYLGVTFHLSGEDGVLVEGTPRSGAKLMFDKQTIVVNDAHRSKDLKVIINKFKDSPTPFPPNPKAVLDSWGHGDFPSSLIPLEVMNGSARLNSKHLSSLTATLAGHSGASTSSESRASASAFSSSASLEARIKKAPAWLQTHLRGFWINRLHSGTWNLENKSPDRSIASSQKAERRAWVDLHVNTCRYVDTRLVPVANGKVADVSNSTRAKYYPKTIALLKSIISNPRFERIHETCKLSLAELGVYTSTSFATVDLLDKLRDPKAVKIGKSMLKYKGL